MSNAGESVRPVLGFVGPMVGRNEGFVTSQGEILADLLIGDGWTVRETSSRLGRLGRLADTARDLTAWRGEVDVAVISVYSGPSFVMADVSSQLAQRNGMAVVLWLHGGSLGDFSLRHPRWVARVLARADQTLAPSRFLVEEVAGIRSPCDVVPNIVDLDTLPFRTRRELRPRLLWMRALHRLYNPVMAVRALEHVRTSHPAATLTMAGPERGLEGAVREASAQVGLTDVIDMVGFLGPAAKAAAFDGHDIYLHTNDVDNTPVSVLEAAAAGLPIIATSVGGIPHLLKHEHNAILVEPGDAGAMASAVDRLLTDPDLAERLSRGGRELAERSAWPAVRPQWESLLREVQRRGAGRWPGG